MKTYNSRTPITKKSLITLLSVLVLTITVITLTVVFALNSDQRANQNVGPIEEANKPTEQFSIPTSEYTVIKEASIDKLVYMPSLNMWKTHNGVDFGVKEKSPINSVYSGKVEKVETSTLEGVVVTVKLNNGMTAIYKSLSSASVKVGDSVANGAQIGVAGTMLSESDLGVHLHLELKKDGKFVNPLEFIDTASNK